MSSVQANITADKLQDQFYSEESGVHSQKSQSPAIPQLWGKYMWAAQGDKADLL